MKKICVFLVLCAVAYGCWYAFSKPEESENLKQEVVSPLSISEKTEMMEMYGDTVISQTDTLVTDTVMKK